MLLIAGTILVKFLFTTWTTNKKSPPYHQGATDTAFVMRAQLMKMVGKHVMNSFIELGDVYSFLSRIKVENTFEEMINKPNWGS